MTSKLEGVLHRVRIVLLQMFYQFASQSHHMCVVRWCPPLSTVCPLLDCRPQKYLVSCLKVPTVICLWWVKRMNGACRRKPVCGSNTNAWALPCGRFERKVWMFCKALRLLLLHNSFVQDSLFLSLWAALLQIVQIEQQWVNSKT